MILHIISFIFLLSVDGNDPDEFRYFEVNDQKVKTTIHIDERFFGKYQGDKSGYLLLNADGTGEYQYDIFGFAPSDCKKDVIYFEWGFLVDEDDQVIRIKREYGYSYPVIYRVTGNTSFQGCSKEVFIDYILEYRKDRLLTVSSSDNWTKN